MGASSIAASRRAVRLAAIPVELDGADRRAGGHGRARGGRRRSGLMREAYRLLSSGDRGAFQDKYRAALQDSPDVVMTHAGISGKLRRQGVADSGRAL